MRRSLDRDAPERDVIAAHSLYIASLARTERVRHAVGNAVPGVTERDLLGAESEHHRRFVTPRDHPNALGTVPRGLTARLPPEPDTNA